MHFCHPTMRPYLADLEARFGLPITYCRWFPRYLDTQHHRHEIELFGPYAGVASPFSIPHGDIVHTPDVVWSLPDIGQRIELTLADNIYPVAFVQGRRIRLAFDLEKLFEVPGDLLPGQVLEAVLAPAMALAAHNVKDYNWSAESDAFVHWNVTGVDAQIATWRGNVRDNEYELDRLCAMSAGVVRKNSEIRENINAASKLTKEDRLTKAKSEFALLTKMIPEVIKSIAVEHSRLIVVLQPITLEHDYNDYELGTITLTITADNVRIASDLSHRYPHPHVSSDGVPCWGNLGSVIARALGEREYVGLVVAIVEFLKSYNENDAYRKIEHWDPNYDEDNE